MPVGEARRRCEEILETHASKLRVTASALRALAGLAAQQGHFDEAAAFMARDRSITDELGSPPHRCRRSGALRLGADAGRRPTCSRGRGPAWVRQPAGDGRPLLRFDARRPARADPLRAGPPRRGARADRSRPRRVVRPTISTRRSSGAGRARRCSRGAARRWRPSGSPGRGSSWPGRPTSSTCAPRRCSTSRRSCSRAGGRTRRSGGRGRDRALRAEGERGRGARAHARCSLAGARQHRSGRAAVVHRLGADADLEAVRGVGRVDDGEVLEGA